MWRISEDQAKEIATQFANEQKFAAFEVVGAYTTEGATGRPCWCILLDFVENDQGEFIDIHWGVGVYVDIETGEPHTIKRL